MIVDRLHRGFVQYRVLVVADSYPPYRQRQGLTDVLFDSVEAARAEILRSFRSPKKRPVPDRWSESAGPVWAYYRVRTADGPASVVVISEER